MTNLFYNGRFCSLILLVLTHYTKIPVKLLTYRKWIHVIQTKGEYDTEMLLWVCCYCIKFQGGNYFIVCCEAVYTFCFGAFRKCIRCDGEARELRENPLTSLLFLSRKSFYLDARGNMTVSPSLCFSLRSSQLTEPRVLHMLGKCSTSGPQQQSHPTTGNLLVTKRAWIIVFKRCWVFQVWFITYL